MVKNHTKDGKWIEYKSNSSIDIQKYPEFTDPYTLEAEYKNGLPARIWTFYKLLQNIMKKQENLSSLQEKKGN